MQNHSKLSDFCLFLFFKLSKNGVPVLNFKKRRKSFWPTDSTVAGLCHTESSTNMEWWRLGQLDSWLLFTYFFLVKQNKWTVLQLTQLQASFGWNTCHVDPLGKLVPLKTKVTNFHQTTQLYFMFTSTSVWVYKKGKKINIIFTSMFGSATSVNL